MIEIFTALLGAIFSGGATGLLGVVIQKYFSLKERTIDLKVMVIQHRQAMQLVREENASKERIAKMGADERMAIADMETTARENESADRLMAASFEHDTPRYHSKESEEMPAVLLEKSRAARWLATCSAFLARVLMVLIDFSRGVIRPALTVCSVYLLWSAFQWVQVLHSQMKTPLTEAQAWQLTLKVVEAVLFLGTAIPLWWFGIRKNEQK